jgi:tryptophan synthase alpha chain
MSRIEARFRSLRGIGRRALIPYIMAGDPTAATTVPLMHALVAAGADLIELGVPFSDPMADGPVIQAAGERSLANGIRLATVLDLLSVFRRDDPETPIILMGYLNPIEAMGYQKFAAAAAAAGADGILTVDLPPEEATDLVDALESKGLDPIFLTAPTTTAARLERIAAMGRGFVYYVSLKGVTGATRLDTASVESKIAELREFTGLPLAVGFGISTPEMAVQVARIADAVVVGSTLVKHMAAHVDDPSALTAAVCGLLSEMRQAMDRDGAAV